MISRRIIFSTLAASALLLSGGLAMADQQAPIGREGGQGHGSGSHAGNTQDPFEVCGHLAATFDQGIKGHSGTPSWQDAETLRAEGGRLCANGAPEAGIGKLQTALAEIGIVPQPYY
ncbi:MAG TPA: hypothetical protein VH835_01080 [Dongiaceae bacterium]|jgi:hypothetical protein